MKTAEFSPLATSSSWTILKVSTLSSVLSKINVVKANKVHSMIHVNTENLSFFLLSVIGMISVNWEHTKLTTVQTLLRL